jgi:hypothetical protein
VAKVKSSQSASLLVAMAAASAFFLFACEDDESKLMPNSNLDAAAGSQDAAKPDPPVIIPVVDANVVFDVAVPDVAAVVADANVATADSGFAEPNVDAGSGCALVSPQHTSPAQAGLPTSGLALWLRGDQGVYKDQNNEVCAWVDHSGAGHAFLSAVGKRPSYVPAVGNALPNLRFTGGGRGLSISSLFGIAAQSGRSYIAVQKLVNTTARSQSIIQGQAGTPGTYVSFDTNSFQTAGSRQGVYVTNNAYDSDVATSTALQVQSFLVNPMVIGTAILPSVAYRINGAVAKLTRNPGGLGNTNFENFSGANFTTVGAGQPGSDFSLSEILVYDHALSTQEATQVESALYSRYGIDPQPK